MNLYLNDLAIHCALGSNKQEVTRALHTTRGQADSRLVSSEQYSPGHSRQLGMVCAPDTPLPSQYEQFECRNNRLLVQLYQQIETTVMQLVNSVGPQRVGMVLATSTSGIDQAEQATAHRLQQGQLPNDFHFLQQQLSGGTDFLSHFSGISGPTSTLSTACSSSASALASAARLLTTDMCDAVIVGGVDTLCQFTVQGFAALEAMSAGLSNPFSANRDGINLGEGGALFVLSRDAELGTAPVQLLAVGNSSDAHHISAPHPEGRGALRAMQQALAQARLQPGQVDYLNLHGTGTPQNDIAEGRAVHQLFGDHVACSSTKPLTGHTLGAAGIIESGLCWLSVHPQFNPQGRLIPHIYDGEYDPDIPPIQLVPANTGDQRPAIVLSNSFAFGGNNASVILGMPQ